MARWEKLGIIAGGGNLPLRLAQACQAQGKAFSVIRLKGIADDTGVDYPATECSIAEAGKIFRILHQEKCDAVVMAGIVQRPDFLSLRPDWRGAALLPKLVKAAAKGDGALLSALVDAFEAEGFLVIGAEEILERGTIERGVIGQIKPTSRDFHDIAKAQAVIKALGPFDIGQGAVVYDNQVMAIEAVEGTDAMLERCKTIRDSRNIPGQGGVLVKIPKPGQELRVDLPTIGPETIRRAKAAGLNGIAVAADYSLIIDYQETQALADEAGVFILGFTDEDIINLPPLTINIPDTASDDEAPVIVSKSAIVRDL